MEKELKDVTARYEKVKEDHEVLTATVEEHGHPLRAELKQARAKIDKLQETLTRKRHEIGKLSGIEAKHADLKQRLDEILENKIKAKRAQ